MLAELSWPANSVSALRGALRSPSAYLSSGGTVLLELHLSIRASWEHKLFRAPSAEEI